MKFLAIILLFGFSTAAFGAPRKNEAADEKAQAQSSAVGQLTPDAYSPIRSLAYDIDDAASKILEELLKSEKRDAAAIDAVKSFSLSAHQFRMHVVEYRKKVWDMSPEIARLKSALSEVQKAAKENRLLKEKSEELGDYLDETASLYAKDPKDYVLPDISNGKK